MSEKREYKECYVAVIDLLGFKKTIKDKTCEEIAQYYDEMHEEVKIFNTATGNELVPSDKIQMRVMSDTICFIVECKESNALAGLIAYCAYLQTRLMQLGTPVLSRGGIVKGNIYCEGDVFFGQGIVDAYLLEENVANNPRIIMTKQTFESAVDSCDKLATEYLKTYLYEDSDLFMCVDSLLLFYGLHHESEKWKRFARHVYNTIYSETNPSVREKYIYIKNNFPRISKQFIELTSEEK